MKQHFVTRVTSEGPMYFDEFMEVCLYDPARGFFSAGRVRAGADADFFTSPEVSPQFGSLISRWARDRSRSADALLVEVGAGSGVMLRELAPEWPSEGRAVYAVEVSEAARGTIRSAMPEVIVVSSIADVPRGTDAVVVVNEMLDNVPAALARFDSGEWCEIAVGVVDGELSLVDVAARPDVDAWCRDTFGSAEQGTIVAAQLAASRFVEETLAQFDHVSMCIIDYGSDAHELATRGSGSVVRTYRNHASGHDWLAQPGETDITVDLNTTAIERTANRLGARVETISQTDFLTRLGIREVIDAARAIEGVHAQNGDVIAQLSERSKRVAMEALVDPGGLGGFRVVLVESGT